MRILLVEDDPILGDGLKRGLTLVGYNVDWVSEAAPVATTLKTVEYAALILDLSLPDGSGFDILKRLRLSKNTIPVIILTAKDSTRDKVTGLDLGADDYLVKPIGVDELSARIRAVTRRSQGRATPTIHYGGLILDPEAHTVTLNNLPISLHPKEFLVLRELLENIGRVLSKNSLEQKIYGWNEDIESNAIEVYVHHLRKKLGSKLITTMRGVGYVIEKTPKT